MFIKWICDNYSLIILIINCLFAIVSFFVLLFRKKVKICSSSFSSLLLKLPDFINQAEALKLSGTEKFTCVFSLSLNYLASLDNVNLSEARNRYSLMINDAIEAILSTPQKKEVKNED